MSSHWERSTIGGCNWALIEDDRDTGWSRTVCYIEMKLGEDPDIIQYHRSLSKDELISLTKIVAKFYSQDRADF